MPMSDARPDKPYDIIVWGASGFTGRLAVDYLARHYAEGTSLRWAIAGRNRKKLEQLIADPPFAGRGPPILIADSQNIASLRKLAASTRVILSTVGPYAIYGSNLVEACIENATDYCDLCGEVQWMRQIIDRHQRAAAASGARIVMSCGFDSIPSDLGAWCLHRHALRLYGQTCVQMTLLVRAMKGGASGGTFASMLNAIDDARRDRNIAAIFRDPYALNPAAERTGPDQIEPLGAAFNECARVWTSPFVMAAINTRVVRRSNALLGYPYGRNFRYSEALATGPGFSGWIKAVLSGWGLKLFVLGVALPFTRKAIARCLLPKPGEGPSRADRENGFFDLIMLGKLADGRMLRLRIKGDRDPGYGATSRMLAESAICLALDEVATGGGCWTPASAMGDRLLERLTRNAGLSFELE